MRHDDERTHIGREVVVRIVPVPDILNEISGFLHLSDIVEVGADAAHNRPGPDRLSGSLGKGRDDKAVVIGPGCLNRHLLEERMIEIGQLDP